MTVRNQNFSMHVGETKTVFVALTNEDGSAFDPAGSTMEWWLAKTSHSDTIMQEEAGRRSDAVAGRGLHRAGIGGHLRSAARTVLS